VLAGPSGFAALDQHNAGRADTDEIVTNPVSSLLASGYQSDKPSVWLAEGLTFYLEARAVRQRFVEIAALTTRDDRLGTDFVEVRPPGVEDLVQFTTDDPVGVLREMRMGEDRVGVAPINI
jgi:O-methyltransferase involved in polyketide biosynthesis